MGGQMSKIFRCTLLGLLCCWPSSLPAQIPFSECGTLLQGIECMIFLDDTGAAYDIQYFGSFGHGDEVQVDGDLDPNCQNFCFLPCILNNTIVSCAVGPDFIRGDVNVDGVVNIADPVAQLSWIFLGAPLPCQDSLDANDDGTVNLADPITLLFFLFNQGPPIAGPFQMCGPDPTPDAVDCASYPICP